MGILSKLKTVFRGDIPIYHLPHEALRRRSAAVRRNSERNTLDALNEESARLLPEFAKYSQDQLLDHFHKRLNPSFTVAAQARSNEVISDANAITDNSTWPLMGFGPMHFNGENVWRRDPISGHDWGTKYHADLSLARADGSDIRVLWELNRFGHVLTLARAFEETKDEKFAETFFSHIESWMVQNPYARGPNWGCAMEVALRACNVLAAFEIFRMSHVLTAARLALFLKFFDQHGRFILDNNEFSYIATSNHYLSDVIGLFWIGTLVPELSHAAGWQDLGLREMLREMDKQVLPDGSDFEASSGYHRFVTEMFLHTFSLAKQNRVDIPESYRLKLDAMLEYLSAVTRPDGKLPLVGDCDGSRFLPFTRHDADEVQFLLDLACKDNPKEKGSGAFRDAGIYILRQDDLYLHFNASDCGLNGRGSHGHNDALSIEVFAARPFILDPGSYAYNLDLTARHQFRSTRYHSTVMVDEVEQNTIEKDLPFVIGNEAKPKVVEWSPGSGSDRVSVEHHGYRRLKSPVTHRRTVEFNKDKKYWKTIDDLLGTERHSLDFRLHLAPGLTVEKMGDVIDLHDGSGRHLLIRNEGEARLGYEETFFAPNYGQKLPTQTLVWQISTELPFSSTMLLVPAADDNLAERLELIARITDNS
jgi:hypothetical protein